MLNQIGTEFLSWLVTFGLICVALVTLEVRLGRQKVRHASRAKGLAFSIVWKVAALVIIALIDLVWRPLGITPEPLVNVPARLEWAGWSAAILSPVAGFMLGDFIFYWYHRVQHRFLWRFHAVHHSIRELNALNSWHHVSEQLFWSLFTLGAMFLFGVRTAAGLAIVAVLVTMHRIYLHSTTRFHYGPFALLFIDNRFHRIHHSLEPAHFDRNFGGFTTLWDVLFGTAYFPKKDEWPVVGLADVDEPRTMKEWLDLPLRYRRPPLEAIPAE